jgi:hypothetical protein
MYRAHARKGIFKAKSDERQTRISARFGKQPVPNQPRFSICRGRRRRFIISSIMNQGEKNDFKI